MQFGTGTHLHSTRSSSKSKSHHAREAQARHAGLPSLTHLHTLHNPTMRSVACAAVRARWCLDARYGCKAEVTRLMQEWVQTIGAVAGLNSMDVQLSSGAIGCPESRLELEVTVDSVSEWEEFLSRVPAQEHRAWSQRMQGMVVDGSPVWHVYRVLPLTEEGQATTSRAAVAATGSEAKRLPQASPARASSGGLYLPPGLEAAAQGGALDALLQQEAARSGGWPPSPDTAPPAPPPGPLNPLFDAPSATDSTTADDDVVLDWKGDPMKINKGDRMPRFL